MTDHDTARTDIRRRQREVADRAIAAGGNNGANRGEVNSALTAAGLPTLASEDEWLALHDDDVDLVFAGMVAAERTAIIDSIPDVRDDMKLVDALDTIGMTLDQFHALAAKRASVKLGSLPN